MINPYEISKKSVAGHIKTILLFMCFEITVAKLAGSPVAPILFLPHYIPDVLLFYVNAYVVLNLWHVKGRWIALVFIIIELLCHFILYLWIDMEINKGLGIETLDSDFIKAGYRTVYIFFIGLAYWIVMRNQKQAQEIYELKLQALELQNRQVLLENNYLRAKANPHLTFNVLDVLHGNVETKLPVEASVIKMLADTMDYAISDVGEDGKVPLTREIEHVKKIVALYQFLNLNLCQLQITIDAADCDKEDRIPPLILSTLVDNLFMHGDLMDEHRPATIALTCANNSLSFRQCNLISKRKRQSHGLGLAFIRSCLAFYYADRSEMVITTEDNTYTINLNIEL